MIWSPQQEQAIKAVSDWMADKNRKQVFRLFGYAGSGKTSLAKHFADGVKGLTLFGAFTGKAAMVLRKKGCSGASTIHSMIYRPNIDSKTGITTFTLDRDGDASHAALIVIDECSMVDEELGKDLLSFRKPILVIGDPAQLPPVKGQGFFTHMAGCEPDILLTEVHRQALESPVLWLATEVRQGRVPNFDIYGSSQVLPYSHVTEEMVMGADQVLVGLNHTRIGYNRRMRELKGYPENTPVEGDRLVCLRNDRKKRLFNGGIWTVDEYCGTEDRWVGYSQGWDDSGSRTSQRETLPAHRMVVQSEDMQNQFVETTVFDAFFKEENPDIQWQALKGTQQFTYGYALTTHKAQGSQWDNVTLFDESATFREDAPRWVYTALTRAAEKVIWVRR